MWARSSYSLGPGDDYIDTATIFVTPQALYDILGRSQIRVWGLLQRVMSTLMKKPIHSLTLVTSNLFPFSA